MPQIPLNTFIEFTVAQGPARVSAAAGSDEEYDPVKDFYKRLRERTVAQFVDGWSARQFRRELRRVTTPRKQASYEACRAGLTRWARGKTITARRAPNEIWTAAGLEVRVNPELRLSVNDRKFVVKLYFKGTELSATRRDNMLFLLSETAPQGVRPAILDARRGELIAATDLDPSLDALLISEAAAFAALLPD